LLFRDIKISFGAFASTVSYVDLFSTPESTRYKDAPARFYLAPKGHLLVCSATVAILPEDVLLAAKKPHRHNAFHHKKTLTFISILAILAFIIISSTPSFI
jgi:hypothetical protein